MTFLELCQAVARDSGTVATLPAPTTVLGQTGRLARIVGWVQDAYREIQTSHADWLWMRGTFEGNLLASTRERSGADLGALRFARFVRTAKDTSVATVYDPAIGVEDEGFLKFQPYEEFYQNFLYGTYSTRTGKPSHVTRTPGNRFAFWPLPDKTYVCRGLYHKTPQVLSVDADVPELPEEHHDVIKYKALTLLALFDEDAARFATYERMYNEMKGDLAQHYLPQLEFGRPLA